ncbi:MAG: SDR family oxidoreductase [Bacteroidetes bacterium]|nr:SDR family oxidoreductase [Bacteroidota bacterium]
MNNWNLDGKVALITGGSKGIGLAIVQEFLSLGAEVFFVARTQNDVLKIINANKESNLHGVISDVSTEEGREKIYHIIKTRAKKLDFLVNNVGTNIRKKSTEYTPDEYDKIMNTNLKAAFELTKNLHSYLKKSKDGSVVNIASVSGLESTSSGVVYAMTKAAMIQMTKYLAVEWASDKIRVNAIAPWYIKTPLVKEVMSDKKRWAKIIDWTPMKRVGNPEEIAGLAAFLCMKKASFITGQCIAADGGLMAGAFY